MLYPTDEHLRECAFARMSAEAEVNGVDDAAPVTVRAVMIRLLLEAPSFKEFKKKNSKATQDGLIAGELLVFVYLMAEVLKLPKPSVNKAIYAYIKWSEEGFKWGDGRPVPHTESTIRNAWSTHKGVAHLWGALRINESYPFAEREDIFGEGWDTFLGVAADLFRFGCTFTPENVQPPEPVLDRALCWSLPATIAPRFLKTDRMPDRLLALLKDYKAPQPM